MNIKDKTIIWVVFWLATGLALGRVLAHLVSSALILENLQPFLYALIIGILIGAVGMLVWVSWRFDKW